MKVILLSLMPLLLFSDSSRINGTYQIVDDLSFDTLKIRKNGTYLYKERGDSCWMWNDFTGDWELTDNILTLFETQKIQESIIDIEEKFFETPKDSVQILVKSIDNSALENFTINYEAYFDSYPKYKDKTNENGIVSFKKYDIEYLHHDESTLEFEIIVNGEKTIIRQSANQNADKLVLIVNQNPDFLEYEFEHKFKIKNERLISIQSERLNIGKKYKKL